MVVFGRYHTLTGTQVTTSRQFNTNILTDFVTKAMQVTTKEEIMSLLDAVAHHYGMDTFAISGIPLPGERIDPYVLLNAWPKDWFARYAEKNFVQVDPVIYRTKITNDAFVWSEALGSQRLGKGARRVMAEATEFKMLDGFSVPLHGIHGLQAIVTFSAEKVDLSEEMRATLQLIAIYAHNRLRAMLHEEAMQPARERLNVTPREQEIVMWFAAGKNAWETAQILGISEKTVRHQIEHLRRKMNVVNVAQMIAEAFRLGIIR